MVASVRLLVASCLVFAACESTEPEPGGDGGPARVDADAALTALGCEDTAFEWYEGLIPTPEWRACSTDEECVLASNEVRCDAEDGDLHFAGCGIGIATRSSDDYESLRGEREAALCARSDRPRCEVSSACGDMVAFCDDGACSERTRPTREEEAALAAQCASRALHECDADGQCYVIEGTLIDLERECAGAMEPAACVTEWRAGGGGAPVCVDDPAGNTWLFPGGVPVDWIDWRPQSDCLNLDACD